MEAGYASWKRLGEAIFFLVANCTKFGKLILRKITKTVATTCRISKLKLTIFDSISAGALPQIPLGELTALPRPLAGFKGAYV